MIPTTETIFYVKSIYSLISTPEYNIWFSDRVSEDAFWSVIYYVSMYFDFCLGICQLDITWFELYHTPDVATQPHFLPSNTVLFQLSCFANKPVFSLCLYVNHFICGQRGFGVNKAKRKEYYHSLRWKLAFWGKVNLLNQIRDLTK